MNKENSDIINKFLLIGDKFMPEMHFWDPKVEKYSACGPFTRHQKRIDMFMKDGRLSHILKNRLDAACFQHDSTYAEYKDRVNRIQSDIVLKNKALKIATDPRVNGCQRGLTSIVYKFFNERTKGSGINNKGNLLVNSQLAEELHKPIIKDFNRRKVYSSFKDNVWGVDLADMQFISKYNKGIRYLLCFKENDIEIYSTFDEGKSVVAERFMKTLKNKIYKHMTYIGKNVYVDVLDDIVKKYHNTDSSIKMKPKGVTDIKYVKYSEETNKKVLNLK